jgi:hypothetical protein
MKMSRGNRRTPGEIWHDVRCLEEHFRVLTAVICAIGAQKGVKDVETGTSEDERDATENGLAKGSLYGPAKDGSTDGTPADGGNICVPGWPCDGGLADFGAYVDSIDAYYQIILDELRALIGTLDKGDRIRLCGGMLCTCPPGKRKNREQG